MNPRKVVKIQGQRYGTMVVRVAEKDHAGRPLLLRVHYPGDEIRLSEDENANEFAVIYGQVDTFGDPSK